MVPNCVPKNEEVQRDEYGDPIGGPKISKKQLKKNLMKNEPDEKHTTTTSEEVISERQKDSDNQRLSQERGRSNYGKASVRNMRATGTGGNAADPAERLVAMDTRHKAHKEKRGIKTKVKEEVGVSSSSMMMKARKEAELRKKEHDAVSKKMKKEETITLQDANGNDFVEVIDIISSKKIYCDWRNELDEGAAWTKKSGKNKEGGLNEKGRKSYERDNPGSDLKAPSKKVGNKRRASFCARMKGMKKKLTSAKTARDPDSRINKSLRKWNC